MGDAAAPPVDVRFRNDRWRQEGASEWTTSEVDDELASLFAYARCWAADADRPDGLELTFSAMLAAMVAHQQPLCRWLKRYFDALGVPIADITKGRMYPAPTLYPARPGEQGYLSTTRSFRTAFDKAGELRDLSSPGQSIGVRHFMAAYAVCRDYHLHDFRRYRIDRREWCLRLAEELSERFPSEKSGWESYAQMAPPLLPLAFDNDTPDGPDHMHLEREVEAFARLIAARSTSTPLSIGVFGAWGSGKSFFMRRTRERVARIAKQAADDGPRSEHHSRIAQVEFNAWHYSEKELIASLVDHVFRNLRIDPQDEDDETLRRRGEELLSLLNTARQELASAGWDETAAVARLGDAEEELARAQESLPEVVGHANRTLATAEYEESEAVRQLARARAARDAAVGRASVTADATALLGAVADESTREVFEEASGALVALAEEARTTRSRWRPILVGVALLVATIVFALLAGTEVWARLLAGLGAVAAFVTMARSWLVKLSELSDRGERFLAERRRAIDAASVRASAQHDDEIAALEAAAANKRAATAAARERLEAAAQSTEAVATLEASREQLTAARQAHAIAKREVDDLQAARDANTIDVLLREFLDKREDTNDYRARLGVFSQVRNDFERLSKLIARATADYYERGKPPPALSRIVLYIDDLDRCPEDKVVEVLRAVHLLLAFPLFVCVVAVDPRWLTTCLAQAPGVASSSTKLDSQFGKPANAADYIEKIFQVPIWLRPVPRDQRAALVRSWLEDPDASVNTEQPPMTTAELEFLDQLAPMLDGKPRTLKRLANTYRLVKTALSDVEFRTFTTGDRAAGTPAGPDLPYRVCMTQLAVLSADRDRSIAMIDCLEAERSANTVGVWLETLATKDADLAAFLRTTLDPVDELNLDEFRRWLDRTRRYSFYL